MGAGLGNTKHSTRNSSYGCSAGTVGCFSTSELRESIREPFIPDCCLKRTAVSPSLW